MSNTGFPEPPVAEIALSDGPWLDYLDPAFLARAYPGWAKDVASMTDAGEAFKCRGFPEMAAIGEGHQFDAVYFAEANPAWQGVHELKIYRYWLLEGVGAGVPGSGQAHLRKLGLNLERYPSGFPWRLYGRLVPSGGAHRWAALDDFVAGGFAAVLDRLCFGPDAVEFLTAAGTAFSQRDDRLAVHAFELARQFSKPSHRDEQHLADAYLRLGLWRPAYDLYRGIVAAGHENAWTIRNLARCVARTGQSSAFRDDVNHAKSRLAGKPMWHEAVSDAVGAIFQGYENRARALMADGAYAEADHLLMDSVADLATWAEALSPTEPRGTAATKKARPKVLFLANLDDPMGAYRRVDEKLALLDQLGIDHKVVPYLASDDFSAELPEADMVIFFRVPALPQVLRSIVAARLAGVPTYYDTNESLTDADNAAPIGHYRGLLTVATYDGLRFGTPLYRAAARLCDFGIGPTGRIAETVRALVSRRCSFVVKDALTSDSLHEVSYDEAEPRGRLFLRAESLTFLDVAPETCGEQLMSLLTDHPELELVVSGPIHLDPLFDRLGHRIRHLGQALRPQDHRSELLGAVANILVCVPTPDGEYETELGWAAAAYALAPSVALLPDGVLPDLRHGKNVLRAATPSGVGLAIRELLSVPGLCQRIAQQARRDVSITRSTSVAATALEQALAFGRDLRRDR